MANFTGSCNCGNLKYEVAGEIKTIVNCHCRLCRKMNGAAFSTYVVVSEGDFRHLQGDLKTHEVSSESSKSVCENCATPIFNSNPKFAGLKILHLGSLDDPAKLVPQHNIYCESQLAWLQKLTALNSFEQGIG